MVTLHLRLWCEDSRGSCVKAGCGECRVWCLFFYACFSTCQWWSQTLLPALVRICLTSELNFFSCHCHEQRILLESNTISSFGREEYEVGNVNMDLSGAKTPHQSGTLCLDQGARSHWQRKAGGELPSVYCLPYICQGLHMNYPS